MSKKTNKGQRRKVKRAVRVLKLKHPVAAPDHDSEPVRALVEAITAKEVIAIKFVNPEPTRWQRIKAFWAGDPKL